MGCLKKNGNWFIDYRDPNGKRVRKKIGSSKALAEQALAKVQVEIAEGKYLEKLPQKKISFDEFSEIYLNDYAIPNKRSWKSTDKIYIGHWKELFGKRYLYTINPHEIERYKSQRIKTLSPAGVNRELACLKTMFNKAIDWGFTAVNPVKRVKLFRENNQRVRFLTPEEFSRLLSHCSDRLARFVILAVSTGMRKGEIQNLRSEDVDFKLQIIKIKQQKNGETSYIPINQAALKVLARGFDFGYNPRKSFELAVSRAGIQDFRFHDLRHTFCSWLAIAGVPINTIRELARHKDIKMTLRYAHLSPDSKAQSVRVLDGQILDTFGHFLDTSAHDEISNCRKSLKTLGGGVAQFG